MHLRTATTAALFLLPGALLQPASAQPISPPPPATELVARLLPEIVSLTVETRETTPAVPGNMLTQPSVTEKTTEGTGFIVDAGGVIATNRHVIANAADIIATLQDGTRLRAAVLASAVHSDLALLKVEAGRPLPPVHFGDSDAARPGDRVLVIGNPLGLGGTVTRGIVSALGRTSAESESDAFMQIDAAFNRGNSGAPVFNTGGQVIAVGTALFSPGSDTGSVGLGLAIPANDAVAVINQLWADGHDSIGWIGARVQGLTADIAAALGRPTTAGSIVLAVKDGGPAAQAGLGAGDVILKVNGAEAPAPRFLNRMIAGSRIGGTVALTVWRDGAVRIVPMPVRALPSDTAAAQQAATDEHGPAQAPPHLDRDDLGLVTGPVTDAIARRLGLAAVPRDTVALTAVPSHSTADDHGITAGSLLLDVGRKPVAYPAEVQQQIDAARAAHQGFVLLLVQDRSGLRWISLPLE